MQLLDLPAKPLEEGCLRLHDHEDFSIILDLSLPPERIACTMLTHAAPRELRFEGLAVLARRR
jgi:NifU-like protein involved in Fe-S cluster formation